MMERVSVLRKPRPGAYVEFVCDDSVHPTFNFGQVQASRPQIFTTGIAIQFSVPPPPEFVRKDEDKVKKTRSGHTSMPTSACKPGWCISHFLVEK